MPARLRKSLAAYLQSAWLPGIVTCGCLVITSVAHLVALRWPSCYSLTNFAALLLGLSLLGILASGITQLVRRHWRSGLINLVLFPVLTVGAFVVLGIFAIHAMFGPSEDGFGKDIVIPPDMVLENPLPKTWATNAPAGDALGNQLIASFTGLNQTGALVTTDLKCLEQFHGPYRALLLRHLASSARWFLTTERGGKLYAYRRFASRSSMWRNSGGYYGGGPDFVERGTNNFQFCIFLGIDGPVMFDPRSANLTRSHVGAPPVLVKAIEDKKYDQGIESHLVLESSGAALEIFEQSRQFARPFTVRAVAQVKDELEAVLSSPRAREHGFDETLLPPESIKRGSPELHLVGTDGIYQVYARINPRAAGRVYLKVFEATRNTRLSAGRIAECSLEYTGWSDDPQEQFFYNTEITVYEGDWGVYYPARFELWFMPQDGGPERKLMEKTFKIEGWQR